MANTKRKKGISKSKRRSKQRDRKSTKEKFQADRIYDIERRYYTLDQITKALGLKIPENHDVQVRHLGEKYSRYICIEIFKGVARHDERDDDEDEEYY